MSIVNAVVRFIVDNWAYGVVLVAFIVSVIVAVKRFCSMAANDQEAKVKEWLLYAVTVAEAELGGGTGRLKLATVYNMFVETFPMLKNIVSLAVFGGWVDEVLVDMRHMLETNDKINEVVTGTSSAS